MKALKFNTGVYDDVAVAKNLCGYNINDASWIALFDNTGTEYKVPENKQFIVTRLNVSGFNTANFGVRVGHCLISIGTSCDEGAFDDYQGVRSTGYFYFTTLSKWYYIDLLLTVPVAQYLSVYQEYGKTYINLAGYEIPA